MKKLLSADNILGVLLVFVPVAFVLDKVLHASKPVVFAASALAIVPLAGFMGKATEHLAESLGAGIGGLLNATFGNAAELIIALMGLHEGLYDVVKASITGSIIGNVLLVFGLSIVAGGARHKVQRFNRTAASLGSTMLTLSVIGLVVPAIFHFIARGTAATAEREVSLEIAVVLAVVYVLSLFFSLKTHKFLYVGDHVEEVDEAIGTHGWSRGNAVGVLLAATATIAVMSELLVGAIEETASHLGMTPVFVGVILLAVIGNAAENSTAIFMALKNKMDLALNIVLGSSTQIALFVAPVLLFASYALGPEPMNLVFTPMEVVAITLSVGIATLISQDGESNWMEGVQLLAVYVILGIAFFFLPV